MRVYMIRYRPTGQFATRSFPKLAAAGNLGRVYGKHGHARGILSSAAHHYNSELRYRKEHPEWYLNRPEMHEKLKIQNPEFWEIVEFDLTEVQSEPDL